jgi:hypothetical protein
VQIGTGDRQVRHGSPVELARRLEFCGRWEFIEYDGPVVTLPLSFFFAVVLSLLL